jgi:hypothetical protein
VLKRRLSVVVVGPNFVTYFVHIITSASMARLAAKWLNEELHLDHPVAADTLDQEVRGVRTNDTLCWGRANNTSAAAVV